LKEKLSSEQFSCVVYGLESSFVLSSQVNEITRELNLPFYCLNSSGLNAFMFCDLATDSFEFQHNVKDPETGESSLKIGQTKGSVSFKDFTESLIDVKKALKWNKRDLAKPEKLLLLAIVQMLLTEGMSIEEFVSQKEGLSAHKTKLI